MKSKSVAKEAIQNNTKLVSQLNDLHDGFNTIRKITSFLGTSAIHAALHLCDDDVEGAECCFRLLNENFMAELDNLDHLITEVKAI